MHNWITKFYTWATQHTSILKYSSAILTVVMAVLLFTIRKKSAISIIVLVIALASFILALFIENINSNNQSQLQRRLDDNDKEHKRLLTHIDVLEEESEKQVGINKRTITDHNRLASKEAEDDVKHDVAEATIERESIERDNILGERIEKYINPQPQIDLTFSNGENNLIARPKYKKISYHAKQATEDKKISQIDIFTNPIQAIINGYSTQKDSVEPYIVKPIRKRIFHSFCPVSFKITNTGECEISNFKIKIEWNNADIEFRRKNEEDVIFPGIIDYNRVDTTFNDGKSPITIKPLHSIAPKDEYFSNTFYFLVPIGVNEINLQWTMYKGKEPQKGELKINVEPYYEDFTVMTKDANLIGNKEVELYVEGIE